jgi:hypothetical protein
MNLRQLRIRRLRNMQPAELHTLNQKLVGKGHHWLTPERMDVCRVHAEKLSKLFEEANQ